MTLAGLVGFAKDYGTTRSFKDTGTDELFFILQSSALLLPQHEPLVEKRCHGRSGDRAGNVSGRVR